MTTPLLSLPIFRAFDSAGLPLAGGLLYTYSAGTTTPLATYSDSAGASPNANPVVLDSTGTATVRLSPGIGYKFVLKDSGGSTQWTEDNYIAPGRFDIPIFIGGSPAASLKVINLAFNRTIGFPAGLTGSTALAVTASTGTATFNVNKNGGNVGTITFPTSATGQFVMASAQTFNSGDVLNIVAPSSADATLADISITLAGFN